MSFPPKKMIDDIKRQFGDAEIETWITYDTDDGRPCYHWKRKEKK